jgi:hypothetical protein
MDVLTSLESDFVLNASACFSIINYTVAELNPAQTTDAESRHCPVTIPNT